MNHSINSKNILILGGSGMLGDAACRFFEKYAASVFAASRSAAACDSDVVKSFRLENYDLMEISDIILKANINIVFNCIGLTSVEACENNPSLAIQVNAIFPAQIATLCYELNIQFVQISTDHYSHPHCLMLREDETQIELLNIYSQSKRQGELNVLSQNPYSLVVRTNFFGNSRSSKMTFSDFIITNLLNEERINLFTDVLYTPIDMFTLFEAITVLLELSHNGIINICSDRAITKCEFGHLIASELNLNPALIVPSEISKRSDLVIRPSNMSLSSDRLKELVPNLGLKIEQCIKRVTNGN